MNNYDYDVIIIGAGPAGSAAAIHLSESGFNVCLIEKRNFPRDILCGEFLSHEVIYGLKRIGIFEEFTGLSPNKLNYFKLINYDDWEINARLNFTAYGLRRSVFDNFLINIAKKRGAKILQPAEVKDIKRGNIYYTINIWSKNIGYRELTSKYVIAAYGRQNSLDKNIQRSFVYKKSNLNGIQFHMNSNLLNEFDKEEIRIYTNNNIYCGINAVDGSYVTICFLEKRDKLKIPSKENLINHITGTGKFKDLFKPGYEELIKSQTVFGTGNIFFGKRNTIENGIFMVGDAAGVIAPIAGDGIGMAFQSAEIIARILCNVRTGKISIKEAENIYQAQWRNKFRNRLFTSLFIQNLMLNNYGRVLSVNILKRFPQILLYFINATRG